MTRKLTDEQVKAIKEIHHNTIEIPVTENFSIYIKRGYDRDTPLLVVTSTDNYVKRQSFFDTDTPNECDDTSGEDRTDEAIAYVEHLLNQRYCWLPQNNSWIMSGEVYNFANGGANKVLELMHINDHFSWFAYWMEYGIPWFLVYDLEKLERGYPTPEQLSKGITIPADSPIWDAVKGV
jgi:hypothetical protein